MSAIKAGDLVMVVKPRPCCAKGLLGVVFTVAAVKPPSTGLIHCDCGATYEVLAPVAWRADDRVAELWRLIKIDPPAQPESVDTDNEVMA